MVYFMSRKNYMVVL